MFEGRNFVKICVNIVLMLGGLSGAFLGIDLIFGMEKMLQLFLS